MKRRIWTVAVGLAAVAALIAVPAAMAAYTSPKLEVTQTATGVVVKASLDPNDDPTARVAIIAPAGTQLTTTQAPGTVLGPVQAIVKALDLAGADLPLEGQLVVAAPGQVPAATAGRVHRARDAARDLGDGAHGRRADADRADVPRLDRRHADRARPGVHRDLPAAARRARRARPAARRSARRSTAPSSRSTASSARSPRARGSPPGCRTPGRGHAERRGRRRLAGRDRARRGEPSRRRAPGSGAIVTEPSRRRGQPRAGATVTVFGGSAKAKLTTRQARARLARTGGSRTKFAGRDVLPRRRGRDRRSGAAALHAAAAADRRGAVRQPDGRTASPRRARSSGRSSAEPLVGGRLAPAPYASSHARDRPSRHVQLRGRGPRQDLVPARRLDARRRGSRYYSERFDTVEVDSPYYHLPDPAVTGRWAQRTPPEFTFHVKAHKSMTWHEGEPTDAGVRRVPRVARAARALGEAPRDPPAVPPAVREVARGDGRARARPRRGSTRSSRSSSSGTARGWSRTSAPTRSRSSSATASRTCRSTRR